MSNLFLLPSGNNNRYQDDINAFIKCLQNVGFPEDKIREQDIDIEDTDLVEEVTESGVVLKYGDITLISKFRSDNDKYELTFYPNNYHQLPFSGLLLTEQEKAMVNNICQEKKNDIILEDICVPKTTDVAAMKTIFLEIIKARLIAAGYEGNLLAAKTKSMFNLVKKVFPMVQTEDLIVNAKTQLFRLMNKVLAMNGHDNLHNQKYRLLTDLSARINNNELRKINEIKEAASDFIRLSLQQNRWSMNDKSASGKVILECLNSPDFSDLKKCIYLKYASSTTLTYADLQTLDRSSTPVAYFSKNRDLLYSKYTAAFKETDSSRSTYQSVLNHESRSNSFSSSRSATSK